MKEMFKTISETMSNVILETRDFGIWVFNYKKLKKEYENEGNCIDHIRIEYNNKIKALSDELQKCHDLNKEKDNLIRLRENHYDNLRTKYVELKNINNELEASIVEKEVSIDALNNEFAKSIKDNKKLQSRLEKKELQRRKSAGRVGGYQKHISKLEQELLKAKNAVNYYKSKMPSPEAEQIKAYDYPRREVLKRQKAKNKQSIYL